MTPEQLIEQDIAAFAAWKKDRNTPLEFLRGDDWVPSRACTPSWDTNHYRIAPFTLGNSINGHTLGEGEQWQSRNLWRAGMLNAGERPLLYQEKREVGDWFWNHEKWIQHGPDSDGVGRAVSDVQYLHKTTRLLPSAQVAPGHNPDKLTCAQVGTAEGWRLADAEEGLEQRHTQDWWNATEFRTIRKGEWKASINGEGNKWMKSEGIRTRLSREELAALDAPPAAKKPEASQWTPEASRALHEKASHYEELAKSAMEDSICKTVDFVVLARSLRAAANVMDGVSAS